MSLLQFTPPFQTVQYNLEGHMSPWLTTGYPAAYLTFRKDCSSYGYSVAMYSGIFRLVRYITD